MTVESRRVENLCSTDMGAPVRERYNTKARGSSVKKGKPKKNQPKVIDDPNIELFVPRSAEAKDDDRKEKMRVEVSAMIHPPAMC